MAKKRATGRTSKPTTKGKVKSSGAASRSGATSKLPQPSLPPRRGASDPLPHTPLSAAEIKRIKGEAKEPDARTGPAVTSRLPWRWQLGALAARLSFTAQEHAGDPQRGPRLLAVAEVLCALDLALEEADAAPPSPDDLPSCDETEALALSEGAFYQKPLATLMTGGDETLRELQRCARANVPVVRTHARRTAQLAELRASACAVFDAYPKADPATAARLLAEQLARFVWTPGELADRLAADGAENPWLRGDNAAAVVAAEAAARLAPFLGGIDRKFWLEESVIRKIVTVCLEAFGLKRTKGLFDAERKANARARGKRQIH